MFVKFMLFHLAIVSCSCDLFILVAVYYSAAAWYFCCGMVYRDALNSGFTVLAMDLGLFLAFCSYEQNCQGYSCNISGYFSTISSRIYSKEWNYRSKVYIYSTLLNNPKPVSTVGIPVYTFTTSVGEFPLVYRQMSRVSNFCQASECIFSQTNQLKPVTMVLCIL